MRSVSIIKENILEILCNCCMYSNIITNADTDKICSNCEKRGDYKAMEELLNELEDSIKEDIEYDSWEWERREDL